MHCHVQLKFLKQNKTTRTWLCNLDCPEAHCLAEELQTHKDRPYQLPKWSGHKQEPSHQLSKSRKVAAFTVSVAVGRGWLVVSWHRFSSVPRSQASLTLPLWKWVILKSASSCLHFPHAWVIGVCNHYQFWLKSLKVYHFTTSCWYNETLGAGWGVFYLTPLFPSQTLAFVFFLESSSAQPYSWTSCFEFLGIPCWLLNADGSCSEKGYRVLSPIYPHRTP